MTFEFQEHLLGGVCETITVLCVFLMILIFRQASIDATGFPLTDDALTAAKEAHAVLLGAIGGPVNSIPPLLSSLDHEREHPKIDESTSRNGALAPSARSKAS